jgi:hypothetical protein
MPTERRTQRRVARVEFDLRHKVLRLRVDESKRVWADTERNRTLSWPCVIAR